MDLNIGDEKYILTNHAKKRMESRGIDLESLIASLQFVKRRLSQEEGKSTMILIGENKIAAVVAKKHNVIITVFHWKRDYYRSKNKSKHNKKRRALIKKHGNRIKR